MIDSMMMGLIKATTDAMVIVARTQGRIVDCKAKSDDTLVTEIDFESQAVGLRSLHHHGLDIWSEETVRVGDFTTDEVILFDPLDGTRSFTMGAVTSTVIAATYNWRTKTVTRCVVGEPATGRVWFAATGQGTWLYRHQSSVEIEWGIENAIQCQVWDGQGQGTVLLDLAANFTKPGFDQISNRIWGRFFGSLFGPYHVNMFGSNGLHHALVANGGQGMAASVTTALGGPWDAAPVLLVLEAGGAAQGFHHATAINPLAVTDYNLLITANSEKSVRLISRLLQECLR